MLAKSFGYCRRQRFVEQSSQKKMLCVLCDFVVILFIRSLQFCIIINISEIICIEPQRHKVHREMLCVLCDFVVEKLI